MKIARRHTYFYLIFFISLLLIGVIYAQNGYSLTNYSPTTDEDRQYQLTQAENAYQQSYNKVSSRIITNLTIKNNKLYDIINKFKRSNENIRISLYNSERNQPAAFCFPEKKHIFISVELLTQIDYEDEMAFILAHELSHITHNNPYAQKEKLTFFEGTKSIPQSNNNAGYYISLAEEMELLKNRYSLEFKADENALTLLSHGSYSSFGAIAVLRSLGKSVLDTRTDTHPAITQRISTIKNLYNYNNNPNNAKQRNSSNLKNKINMSKYSRGMGDIIDPEVIQKAIQAMNDYYKNN